MKKFLATLAVLTMSSLVFAGCMEGAEETPATDGETPAVDEVVEPEVVEETPADDTMDEDAADEDATDEDAAE